MLQNINEKNIIQLLHANKRAKHKTQELIRFLQGKIHQTYEFVPLEQTELPQITKALQAAMTQEELDSIKQEVQELIYREYNE